MLQKLIAIFYSISFLFPTLGFVVLGKESGLFAGVGLCYLLATLLILWSGFVVLERRRPRRKEVLLAGLGAALLGMAFPLHYAAEKYDGWHDQEIIEAQRNTQVFDLRDEPFRSAAGSLLGVRLSYSIRFPKGGRYSPAPRLLPVDQALAALRGLTVLNAAVEPSPTAVSQSRMAFGKYNAGVTYHFKFEMVPFYLVPSADRSGYCMFFANTEEEQIAQSLRETHFRISIDGTSLDQYLTGNAPLSGHAYNLRNFYDGAVAEGARRPCNFDRLGNLP